ncbi:UNVERIFIED_ORG: ABC-type transport system involved in cytochrome c biogenesis ATPase subunit [Variovorax guangxiensis]
MRVTSLELHNFRSFQRSGVIDIGQINVLIGANNSGKSSILKALHLMQASAPSAFADVRIGANSNGSSAIAIGLVGANSSVWGGSNDGASRLDISITASNRNAGGMSLSLNSSTVPPLPNQEPKHFIVPYFSKRKTAAYVEDVRDQHTRQVHGDLSFLAAKLARLGNSSFPENRIYAEACQKILGFVVTAVPSEAGQRPGIYLPDRETLYIDQLGEGVPNIVGLLADLTLARGKLFLIEEPENDLHPQALKALLDLILESSIDNQFVVSTHSNIVVRYLASAKNSVLFNVKTLEGSMPPSAIIEKVEPGVEARINVLRELGYAFADFDLWDGWLILEESSAERIIRDYLVPMFAPKMSRIRTVATGGVSAVTPTFEDFKRLVLFAHLEEAYKGATWVRVDGDEPGKEVVEKLQAKYPDWSPESFAFFKEEQFERYYPSVFSTQISEALGIVDKQQKRVAKKLLLDEVRRWLDEDLDRARAALEVSAAEVISDLQNMERMLY